MQALSTTSSFFLLTNPLPSRSPRTARALPQDPEYHREYGRVQAPDSPDEFAEMSLEDELGVISSTMMFTVYHQPGRLLADNVFLEGDCRPASGSRLFFRCSQPIDGSQQPDRSHVGGPCGDLSPWQELREPAVPLLPRICLLETRPEASLRLLRT
jgi:hypothetical protein